MTTAIPAFCITCGMKLVSGAAFCAGCGIKQAGGAATSEQAPPIPVAEIGAPPTPSAQPAKPASVGRATTLLWASLGIGTLNALIYSDTLSALAGVTVGIMAIITIVSMAISAGLVVMVDSRKNWARVTLLVLGVPGALIWLLSPQVRIVFQVIPFSGILSLAAYGSQVVALVLLFKPEANNWFRLP